jgi:hypothetical protein
VTASAGACRPSSTTRWSFSSSVTAGGCAEWAASHPCTCGGWRCRWRGCASPAACQHLQVCLGSIHVSLLAQKHMHECINCLSHASGKTCVLRAVAPARECCRVYYRHLRHLKQHSCIRLPIVGPRIVTADLCRHICGVHVCECGCMRLCISCMCVHVCTHTCLCACACMCMPKAHPFVNFYSEICLHAGIFSCLAYPWTMRVCSYFHFPNFPPWHKRSGVGPRWRELGTSEDSNVGIHVVMHMRTFTHAHTIRC